jgi:hypothetical protein
MIGLNIQNRNLVAVLKQLFDHVIPDALIGSDDQDIGHHVLPPKDIICQYVYQVSVFATDVARYRSLLVFTPLTMSHIAKAISCKAMGILRAEATGAELSIFHYGPKG